MTGISMLGLSRILGLRRSELFNRRPTPGNSDRQPRSTASPTSSGLWSRRLRASAQDRRECTIRCRSPSRAKFSVYWASVSARPSPRRHQDRQEHHTPGRHCSEQQRDRSAAVLTSLLARGRRIRRQGGRRHRVPELHHHDHPRGGLRRARNQRDRRTAGNAAKLGSLPGFSRHVSGPRRHQPSSHIAGKLPTPALKGTYPDRSQVSNAEVEAVTLHGHKFTRQPELPHQTAATSSVGLSWWCNKGRPARLWKEQRIYLVLWLYAVESFGSAAPTRRCTRA